MTVPEPFAVFDCSLVRCAIGRVCTNLRELWEAVRTVPESVLEHHMMRCALEDYFELYEFPNDLARWCWDALGDHVLGEQLGLVDPYQHPNLDALRTTLLNAIEDRLWGLERVPWCRQGRELHLMESRLITYDTGERIPTVTALAESIERMSFRSLYYHVHEARRRTGGGQDDFTSWLERMGADSALVDRLRSIDFYFLNLNQLRQEILQAFRVYLSDPAGL
ncbi:MAG TPA: DUF5752 family protein [Thermoguttaceae bacterium]